VDAYGAATAIDALGPGGATPLSEGGEVSGGGYAADDALICLCPRRALRAAVEEAPPTASDVISLHASALERVERMAEARGRSTALSRVASLVCALADTLSPPRRLDLIPATLQQRDLAALLAMRHESVCRALGALEDRRALLRGDEGIRILERSMLESA
jgi:CRP-like cAMP-binding protein